LIKSIIVKEKQFVILTSIMVLAIISFISFFSMPAVHGLRSEAIYSVQQSVIPHAKLLYNNQSYDMSPFVSVSNGQLSKVQLPIDGENVVQAIPIKIKQGDTIGFKFSKKPLKVSVFAIDYEAQPSELYGLKKIGSNTFQVLGPQGTQNLEAQVLFDSGHYVSYDLLAYVLPSIRIQQPGEFEIMQGGRSGDVQSSTASKTSPVCSSQAKLDVMGITASIQNLTNNIPVNVLDNNLGTAWSTRGADALSFAKSLVKGATNNNPWLQLDLGTQRLVCMFGIAFANSDTDIDFFTLQTSTDGKNFKDVGSALSTPISPRGLLYWFPDLPQSARFVRIINLGSITSEHTAINEIAVLGH
jgi:F5/8 type C domain-containing protein